MQTITAGELFSLLRLFLFGCFSDAASEGAAKPPGAAFESDEQVNPPPGFLDDPVTGGNGEKKAAGYGG